ncbi:MAG: BamA/TamA family outer membrane protein [Candidatus Latescibacteria bacterium]|nr:BamA/TamA family outer membrane protein [Candidatus Latescibacterota bacterium]NIO57351.1 BamA/TamA family outer membrane protein [Candidatus Latescibacterota bacterium]
MIKKIARSTLQYALVLVLAHQCSSFAFAQGSLEADNYKGWRLSSLEIEGLDKGLTSELKRGLVIPSQFSRFRRRGPVFYPKSLTEDIKRAQLFLARRGFPYATIKPRFEPHPTKETFSLIFNIIPGSPVAIESITLEGFPSSVESAARVTPGLGKGDVFSEIRVERTRASLESMLKHAGFAHARVTTDLWRIDSTHVKLGFDAEPGAMYLIDDILVEGANQDLVPLIRKTSGVKRGARYSPLILQEAQDNLRLLDLFRQIRLTTQEAAPDSLDVLADLVLRKPRSFETGIGYWTDDQIRVRANWIHRNLFRAGRGFSVGGSASRFLQTANVSLWWPALIGARTREVLSAKVESQLEDSYDLLSIGGELSSIYRHSLATTMRFGISVSNVDVSIDTEMSDAFIEQGGLLTVVSFRWTRSSVDNRVSPKSGTTTWVHTEWAPNGFVSENHFLSLETSGALFRPLSNRTVLAIRIAGGIASPTGESLDLLPNKRFYSGGASSMRGFKRKKLGPLDTNGFPLGGEIKLEASVELRTPLVWRFRGALFIDAGQVWRYIEDISADDLEIASGPGLRLQTPVGPVRADLARRVRKTEATQPLWVFHLSIGYPF